MSHFECDSIIPSAKWDVWGFAVKQSCFEHNAPTEISEQSILVSSQQFCTQMEFL